MFPKVSSPALPAFQGYRSRKCIRCTIPADSRAIRSHCRVPRLPLAAKGVAVRYIPPAVAAASKVPVTVPCNARAASLVIAVFPAAVMITFASASKVPSVIPAVATSFRVTSPLADRLELSVIPPADAVASKVPVTVPCNAKAASLVIAVFPAAVMITFASASKVPSVIPAVATSFRVTSPLADRLELSVIPPAVAVASLRFRSPFPATPGLRHW